VSEIKKKVQTLKLEKVQPEFELSLPVVEFGKFVIKIYLFDESQPCQLPNEQNKLEPCIHVIHPHYLGS
jgi:hypothetical protein